jgi:hypothetical protein
MMTIWQDVVGCAQPPPPRWQRCCSVGAAGLAGSRRRLESKRASCGSSPCAVPLVGGRHLEAGLHYVGDGSQHKCSRVDDPCSATRAGKQLTSGEPTLDEGGAPQQERACAIVDQLEGDGLQPIKHKLATMREVEYWNTDRPRSGDDISNP